MTATSTVRNGRLPASSSRSARSALIPGTPSVISSSNCQLRGASSGAAAGLAGIGAAVTGVGVGAVTGGVRGAAHAVAMARAARIGRVFMSWSKSRRNLGEATFGWRRGCVRMQKGAASPSWLWPLRDVESRSGVLLSTSAHATLGSQTIIVLLDPLPERRIRQSPVRRHHVVDEELHPLRAGDDARHARVRGEIFEEQ